MQSKEMIFLAFESKVILNTTMYINVPCVITLNKKILFDKFFIVPCILLKESSVVCTVYVLHLILVAGK